MWRLCGALMIMGAIVTTSPAASAQRLPAVSDKLDEEAAKRLYQEGAQLVESGHASVGVDKLIRAYELSGAALPLFGLAHAYSLMLDHVRTSDIARVILEDHASLAPDLRSRTRLLKAESSETMSAWCESWTYRTLGSKSQSTENPVEDGLRRPLFFSFLPGPARN